MQSPLSRLECACTFTESAQRLSKILDELEKAPNKKEKDLRLALDELCALHQEHVKTHNAQYAHSLMQHHKPPTGGGLLLKTTAYTAGELVRARNPVKPATKKEKRKRKKEPDLGK
jgi:hypothetical protein